MDTEIHEGWNPGIADPPSFLNLIGTVHSQVWRSLNHNFQFLDEKYWYGEVQVAHIVS